ncbi:MAG: hypothetical protein QOF76_143, partial [Solirubrobacteraceae bacterium]|nr:hypothetical protein [Solirubrobacteraceae bacterium]
RVVAHLAVPAQDYRGAHLYDAGAWAFAVRGPVLLVGQDTAELTEALDQRTQDGGFDADQLEPAHPGDVARGLVDLSALLTYAPAELRGLPLAQAVTDGDLTMRAEPGGQLIGTLTADTTAADLTAADLPPHDAGPVKLLDTDALPVFGAADLGEALAPAERALRLALPVTALQLDAIRMRLERAGVALTAPALHGPAWALDTPHGLEVLWHPAQPAPVRAALARAAASYRQPGVTVTRSHGFYAISSNGQFIARVGMIGDTFIAGAAPATDLRFLAQLPETRVTGGGVAMRIPRRTFLPRLLTVAAGTSGAKLTLRFVAAP